MATSDPVAAKPISDKVRNASAYFSRMVRKAEAAYASKDFCEESNGDGVNDGMRSTGKSEKKVMVNVTLDVMMGVR